LHTIIRPAPAKINLFLRIVGQRSDGYHELQTAFQFLDYCDQLSFELRKDNNILRNDEGPDYGKSDLILKAAKLLQSHTSCKLGASIKLNKKIPTGGGLGGGSSDAATTLVALNELWQTKLSLNDLLCLGLKLGADVPIFLHGKAAWAEGVGEKIKYDEFKEKPTLIICPEVHVSTGEVFAAKELTRNSPRIKIPAPAVNDLTNDFTEVVKNQYPEVGKVLKFLADFSPRLSGSGGCVFSQFTKMNEARKILDIIPANWKAFTAMSLNTSPLLRETKTNGV